MLTACLPFEYRCDAIGWKACCVAYFVPFYPVGVTAQRALLQTGWVIGGIVFVLLYTALAINITRTVIESKRRVMLGGAFTVVPLILSLAVISMGATLRSAMRARFNIPGESLC